MSHPGAPGSSPAMSVPPCSTPSSNDIHSLMSPVTETHPCHERLFPKEEDELEEELRRDSEPQGSPIRDEKGGFRHTSVTGSIHEIESASNAGADPSSSIATNLACGQLNEDELELSKPNSDEDVFEDAQEELSPQRKLSLDESEDTESATFVMSEEWRRQRKHIFILSEAGKPIFSLHGDEDESASIVAVMQAMVSFVHDMNDSLRSIEVDGNLIVFLTKGPLILVAVSHGMESETQLSVQLTYLYNQVLSVLTQTQIVKIFEERKGFDLRRMIAGSERLLYSLTDSFDKDPCFMLSAIRVLPMPSSARDTISNSIIQACSKVKNVVFAILLAENQLITLIRMKSYYIHPADLHLIFNLVNSTESFKHSETWIPLCLPKFDSKGFMQAHVSYLETHPSACLLLLTVERDIFFELSEAKKKIEVTLEKNKSTQFIAEGLKKNSYVPQTIGIQLCSHFLYKAKIAAQYIAPVWPEYYQETSNRQRLQGLYMQLQNRLHSYSRPLKLVYFGGKHENVLGWLTQSFELYATFAPTTSKQSAIEAINKLLRWCKKEENSLFILNAPTF